MQQKVRRGHGYPGRILMAAGVCAVLVTGTGIRPAQADNLPIGHHDQAGATYTSGWTCDPDNYAAAIDVHFYEGTAFLGHTRADQEREPAVGSLCGGYRDHGFVWPYPPALKDNATHIIKAYAINYAGAGSNPLLSGSPIAVFIPGGTAAATASKTGTVVTHQWLPVNWGASIANPIVVAGLASYAGGNPAGLRIKDVGSVGFSVMIEEEKSFDEEIYHVAEDVHFVAATAGAIRSDNGVVIGEAGSLVREQGPSFPALWHTVFFKQAYATPPVVLMNMATFNGDHPSHIRLRNITPTSFQFQIEEWEYLDQAHAQELIHYMAITPGTHAIGGTHVAARLAGNISLGWKQVGYWPFYGSSPLVIAQVQTDNDPAPVVTRLRRISNRSFEVRLQQEEAAEFAGRPHGNETVGYIVVQQ